MLFFYNEVNIKKKNLSWCYEVLIVLSEIGRFMCIVIIILYDIGNYVFFWNFDVIGCK